MCSTCFVVVVVLNIFLIVILHWFVLFVYRPVCLLVGCFRCCSINSFEIVWVFLVVNLDCLLMTRCQTFT